MPLPRSPAVTADVVIPDHRGMILLIARKNPPFQGSWALPGGFIEYGRETIEECAVREAKEETGLDVRLKMLLGVRSRPDRDPRGHTVTLVYLCEPLPPERSRTARADDDASDLTWLEPDPQLLENTEFAFDHRDILLDTFRRGLIGVSR